MECKNLAVCCSIMRHTMVYRIFYCSILCNILCIVIGWIVSYALCGETLDLCINRVRRIHFSWTGVQNAFLRFLQPLPKDPRPLRFEMQFGAICTGSWGSRVLHWSFKCNEIFPSRLQAAVTHYAHPCACGDNDNHKGNEAATDAPESLDPKPPKPET